MKPLEPMDGPAPSTPSSSSLKVKKAGFLIHGYDRNHEQSMVAAYNEGRLGAKYKAYLLPTGTVEKDEHVLDAASRETYEETGINVKEMLGRNNWNRLKAIYDEGKETYLDFGRHGFDVQSGPCEGVSILRAKAVPQDFTYVSHAGVPKRTHLFELELKPGTIDTIREKRAVKNPYNMQTNRSTGKVKETTWQQIKKNLLNDQYPPFREMLDWLRTGDMPKNRYWNKGLEPPANLYENTPYGMETTGQLFEKLERKFFDGKPVKWNHELWKEFCDKADSKDYKRLSKAFSDLKNVIGELGITKGDDATIKLDDKDFPLTFYQEGADVIRIDDYFLHAERLSRHVPYYNEAFIELPEGAEALELELATPLKSQYDVMKDRFPHAFARAKNQDDKTLEGGYVERIAQMRQMYERDAHEGRF